MNESFWHEWKSRVWANMKQSEYEQTEKTEKKIVNTIGKNQNKCIGSKKEDK